MRPACIVSENQKEKARIRARAWYRDNKERAFAAGKKWRANNPDAVKRLMDRYYEKRRKNPEGRKINEAKYRENNRAKVRESAMAWYRRNSHRGKLHARKRRAEKARLLHKEHNFEIEKEFHLKAIDLARVTGTLHEVDHIIPISHGGWHHHENLQILPKQINRSKNDDPFWEMQGYKSWRDVPEFLWPEKMKPAYLALLNATVVAP